MKTKKYLSKEKDIFNKDIDKLFFKIKKNTNKLHKAMWYSVNNGGKRLRPIIIKIISQLLGLRKKQYLPAMLCIELIHCYSLVHDDLPSMDDDDYRRGKLSTHKKFNEAQAILAGNSLLTMAFEQIANLDNKKLSKLLTFLVGAEGLAGGQSVDLDLNQTKVSKNKILEIHKLKTACLFEFCVSAPFIINNSTPSRIKMAKKYGNLFGQIYQIMDDIHDEHEIVSSSINILSACKKKEAILLCEKCLEEANHLSVKLFPNSEVKINELMHYIINE
jgi:geranylgeranyl pyrophosphate synthase